MTVRKTPGTGDPAFDPADARAACREGETPAAIAYHLVDEVAERYLDLVDDLTDEIEELEDHLDDWPPEKVRERIKRLRHDFLLVRKRLAPTRDAVRRVVDNRVELTGAQELFPREVELDFADAHDKLLRATEGIEFCRDLLAGVRDYHQAKIANDQNEVMKRLTAIASLLLLPTLVVGVYGQNFYIPELDWKYGYAWSLGLIVVLTVVQLVIFRRKRSI